MSYQSNLYRFRFEGEGYSRRIFALFRDSQGNDREVEVSEEEYQELVLCNRSTRNLQRGIERNEEHLDLTEEEQFQRSYLIAQSPDEYLMNILLIDQLRAAFKKIPAIQARRYLLVKVFGFSYKEIADNESCNRSAVKQSIVRAKKNLRKHLKETAREYL